MDYVGEDFIGQASDEEILGAIRRGAVAVVPAARAAGLARPAQAVQGPMLAAGRQTPPQRLRGFLGLGTVTFNSASGTLLALTVEPQREWRAERLIISRRDGSTATAGIAARLNNVFIGDQPQSPSIEQPAPTEMFAADATVSGIDFDTCLPGQKIRLELSVSAAPTGTELITLSCGMYGDMLRASTK